MAKKLSSVLGVDIGCKTTKIAEIRTQGKQPVLTAAFEVDTPEGAVDHTGVYNAEAVGAAIKDAAKRAGVSVNQVVVTISGQSSVLVRTLEVPRMSATELKEHMQWEINRNIPFSESNVVSDFKPLVDEDPDSQNMDVVMAIAPQSAVDTLLACMKKAGKQLSAIDVEPLSLARVYAFNYDDASPDDVVCVVDLGHMTTSINIYKGGKLLMPRQVPIGGEMFTKAISDAMGVGVEDAETLKRDKVDLRHAEPQASFGGFDTGATQDFSAYNPFAESEPAAESADFAPYNPFSEPDEEQGGVAGEPAPEVGGVVANPFETVHEEPAPQPMPEPMPSPLANAIVDPETQACNNAVMPTVEEFVAEIRRSMDYFQSKGGAVKRVYLSGGGGRLNGLAEYLAKGLAVECDELDPIRRLNVGGKKVDPTFLEQNRLDFAVAVGNGLYVCFD